MTETSITLGDMTIIIRSESDESPVITTSFHPKKDPKPKSPVQLELVRVEPKPLEVPKPTGNEGFIPNDFMLISVPQKETQFNGVHIARNPKPETRVLLSDVANHITIFNPISISSLIHHFDRKYKDKSIHRAIAYLTYLQIIEVDKKKIIRPVNKLA